MDFFHVLLHLAVSLKPRPANSTDEFLQFWYGPFLPVVNIIHVSCDIVFVEEPFSADFTLKRVLFEFL